MRTLCGCFTALLVLSIALGEEKEPKLVVKPEAFSTLVNPNCSHCIDEAKRRADELKDNDRVLAWTRGKYDGGAIPIRFFLNPYRVISDTYGTFVYDPDAGYARAFKPSLDYTFYGWRNGVMVMKHKDGTLFSCLSGIAFDGPRKGERLTSWPTVVTDWGWYVKHYPGGVAYHMYEKYKPTELPSKPHPDSVASRGKADPRLPADEMVLGLDRPSVRDQPRAYRLSDLEKAGPVAALSDHFDAAGQVVILWQKSTRTAAAYRPVAASYQPTTKLGEEGERIDWKPVEIAADGKSSDLPFVDRKTGSRFDVQGRCFDGDLKGRTLVPLDSVQVKWFAWAAEYPNTTIYESSKPAPKEEKPKPTTAAPDKKASDAIKEVAGAAEFLREIPKHFATFQSYDVEKQQVTLLIEGEKVPKAWPLTPDAEIKFMGWWGRAEQIPAGARVWVWLKSDRQKVPKAVFMLADELSEQDIHGSPAVVKAVGKETLTYSAGKYAPRTVNTKSTYISDATREILKPDVAVYIQTVRGDSALRVLSAKEFEEQRSQQRDMLREVWKNEGLPGSIAFAHVYSGEVDLMLDHEAMRWGRSLKTGDKVTLMEKSHRPPLVLPGGPLPTGFQFPLSAQAVVKSVTAWRERTQVRLVLHGLDLAGFETGQRVLLKMTPPTKEVEDSPYPPDIDKARTKDERLDWFLANVYCTCKIGGDICTGHFYTLASCNPNGCAAPNGTRKKIAEKIDQGLSDREIFDDLRAERGATLLKPHLAP